MIEHLYRDLLNKMFDYLSQFDILRLQLVSQHLWKASKKYIKTTHFMAIETKFDLFQAYRYCAAITIGRLDPIKYHIISKKESKSKTNVKEIKFSSCVRAIICGICCSMYKLWMKQIKRIGTIEMDQYDLAEAIIYTGQYKNLQYINDIVNEYIGCYIRFLTGKYIFLEYAIKYNKLDVIHDVLNNKEESYYLGIGGNRIKYDIIYSYFQDLIELAIQDDKVEIFKLLIRYAMDTYCLNFDGLGYIRIMVVDTDIGHISLITCLSRACAGKKTGTIEYIKQLSNTSYIECDYCYRYLCLH